MYAYPFSETFYRRKILASTITACVFALYFLMYFFKAFGPTSAP